MLKIMKFKTKCWKPLADESVLEERESFIHECTLKVNVNSIICLIPLPVKSVSFSFDDNGSLG